MVLKLYIKTYIIFSSQRENCNLCYFPMLDLLVELYQTSGHRGNCTPDTTRWIQLLKLFHSKNGIERCNYQQRNMTNIFLLKQLPNLLILWTSDQLQQLLSRKGRNIRSKYGHRPKHGHCKCSCWSNDHTIRRFDNSWRISKGICQSCSSANIVIFQRYP